LRDHVFHGVTRSKVVNDRRGGMFQEKSLREKRRDEIAGDEFARAVDEETAVGVAVPGNADVRLVGDDELNDIAPVFFDERVGFVIRKPAIDLEAETGRPAGEMIEEL